MTVAKWVCRKCGKKFYTEGISDEYKPVCQCSWNSDVRFLEVNYEPNKKTFEEVKENGGMLRPRWATKRDAFIFTGHLYADNDVSDEEILEKLPF
jgi:hypothetical protein